MTPAPHTSSRPARFAALALLGLTSACSSPAFLSLDPWPGQLAEQRSDAWMSGGRYGEGAIVAGDPPPFVPGEDPEVAAAETLQNAVSAPADRTDLGGLEPAPPGEEPLLAWDGDVVDGPQRGQVVERQDPSRGLEPEPGGRTYLLQLYQDLLDERDHLTDEVRALRKALGEAQSRIDDTSQSTTGLAARLDALEDEVGFLRTENEDLAGRLATAQIRRLEAEKMLLEARIDWLRSADSAAAEAGMKEMAESMSTEPVGGRRP